MALFGGARKVVQKLAAGQVAEPERSALLDALEAASPRARELVSILAHDDAGVRAAAHRLYGASAQAADVIEVAREMSGKTSAQRARLAEALGAAEPDVLHSGIDRLLQGDERSARLGWELGLTVGGPVGRQYLERAVTQAPAAMRGPALRRLLQIAEPAEVADVLALAAESDDARVSSIAVEALGGVDDRRITSLMVARFRDGDAVVRETARQWLARKAAEQPRAVRKYMLQVLTEGEDAVRRGCLEVLLLTGDPEEVLLDVFRAMHDLLGWLRERIVHALHGFGDRLLEPAIALLGHRDPNIRLSALAVAEAFHDPRLVEPLAGLLKSDDWWLKVTACDGLGNLGDPAAVPHLLGALEDDDCCWAAIDALGRIGSPEAINPLAHVLRSGRAELRMEVVRAFAELDDPRLGKLLQVVRHKDESTEVRALAAEALRRMAARRHAGFSRDDETGLVAVRSDSLDGELDQLLAKVRELGGSDVHLSVGEPPMVRVGGVLERLEALGKLDALRCEELVRESFDERQAARFDEDGEVDLCYAVPGVGRYRANAYRQRRGVCATFRCIPHLPPTFAEVGLPGHLTELLDYHQGLIVVSGPSGSGKSTTLAAVLNLINETRASHILTLEDPIEFVHPVKTALLNQREVGKHSDSYARALRGALRQDPDVIMIGELRDAEVIRMALEAAETGHLVITTMHTTSAVATIERLVTSFPPDEHQQVRMSLSDALQFVLSQQLVPRKGGGRVAAFEILKGTFNVGNLIRDDKLFQIPGLMQIGRNVGMQTVNMALADLLERGLITPETAWRRAPSPDEFAHLVPDEVRGEEGAEA